MNFTGLSLTSVSSIMLVVPQSDSICQARAWVWGIGISIALGGLLTKAVRLYYMETRVRDQLFGSLFDTRLHCVTVCAGFQCTNCASSKAQLGTFHACPGSRHACHVWYDRCLTFASSTRLLMLCSVSFDGDSWRSVYNLSRV